MTKTLVLIRHGHRDVDDRMRDNGLTDKGREQARALRRFFDERFPDHEMDSGLWLVSSPKLRCIETLQPLAKDHKREIDVHPELDEAGPRESTAAFDARIKQFVTEWLASPMPLTLACSHGDWLPRAAYHLIGTAPDPRKGSWLELEWRAGRAELAWYVPSFKSFYR